MSVRWKSRSATSPPPALAKASLTSSTDIATSTTCRSGNPAAKAFKKIAAGLPLLHNQARNPQPMSKPLVPNVKLAVIGLGYVGLPLAVEFGKHYPVIGFDVNQKRVDALKAGVDSTLEVSREEMAEASQLSYSSNPADLADINVYIVTVPTPIDKIGRASCRE